MLKSGKKNSHDKKTILTLLLSEKKFLNEIKPHTPPPPPPPPLQVKWSVPYPNP